MGDDNALFAIGCSEFYNGFFHWVKWICLAGKDSKLNNIVIFFGKLCGCFCILVGINMALIKLLTYICQV